MDENTEVSQLLGNFVEQHGDGCRQTEGRAHEITRPDHHAVNEIVNRIAKYIDRRQLGPVHLRLTMVMLV